MLAYLSVPGVRKFYSGEISANSPAGALNDRSSDMAQRHAAQKKMYAQSVHLLTTATKTAPNRTHHIAPIVPDPTKFQIKDAQNI